MWYPNRSRLSAIRRRAGSSLLFLATLVVTTHAAAQTLPQTPLPQGVTAPEGDFLTLIVNIFKWGGKQALFLIAVGAFALGAYTIAMPVYEWYQGRREVGDILGKSLGIGTIMIVVASICAYGLTRLNAA